MTNPTLERAANAAADAAGKTGTYVEADGDLDCLTVDGIVDFYAVARAVLMAVRDIDPDIMLNVQWGRVPDRIQDKWSDIISAILVEGE